MKRENIFNIRETAVILVPDRISRLSYVYAIGIFLLMVGLLTVFLGKLPPNVPLYFTLPWGEARLAPKQMLYGLPGLTVLFLVVNLLVARAVQKLSPLLPKVLAVSTLVVAGMLLIALLGIAKSLIL